MIDLNKYPNIKRLWRIAKNARRKSTADTTDYEMYAEYIFSLPLYEESTNEILEGLYFRYSAVHGKINAPYDISEVETSIEKAEQEGGYIEYIVLPYKPDIRVISGIRIEIPRPLDYEELGITIVSSLPVRKI